MNGIFYFCTYYPNTLAGYGNQLFFESDGSKQTGRIFFKVTLGGERRYSLMFSDAIDSTYADGSKSCKNQKIGGWSIHSLRVAACAKDIFDLGVVERANEINIDGFDFKSVTFSECPERTLEGGDVLFSDEFTLDIEEGGYICVEITFCGERIPYHEESLLPIYKRLDSGWIYDKRMPVPACVACRRDEVKRVCFVGDSITQGIGTEINSYTHWCKVLAEHIGDEYSYWNLGLGYARAEDLASDGIWMEKTLTNDITFVCLGVNDLLQGRSVEDIKSDLYYIADHLVRTGVKTIFQTLPPFDYCGKMIDDWKEINRFILEEIAKRVDFVFDCTSVLGVEGEPHMAKYGGHPNALGCKAWADSLYGALIRAGIF